MDSSIEPLSYAAVVLIAGVSGVMNSVAGGGTFLTFPALTVLGHLSEKAANMTSTVGLWPGSAASIVAARKDFKNIPRSTLLLLVVVSLVGGGVGSLLLINTSVGLFRLVIPWLLAFATLTFACSKHLGRWAAREHEQHKRKWTLMVVVAQTFVAIYGGYFGAGVGILMMAVLPFAGLGSVYQANALKVLLNAAINLVAILLFVLASLHTASSADAIHWPLAAGMVVSAGLGGFFGMMFARKISPMALRAIVLTVGTLLTIAYFYKGYFSA